MSTLRDLAAQQKALGTVPAWSHDLWDSFRAVVLRLLLESCESLRGTAWVVGWKENQFTACVVMELWNLCHRRYLPITIADEMRILSEDILQGKADPDASPRIDVVLRHSNMQRDTYLAVEVKILVGKTAGNRYPLKSAELYYEEGLNRFSTGKYSSGLPYAFMLGLVIAGSLDACHVNLAEHIKSLTTSKLMALADADYVSGLSPFMLLDTDFKASPGNHIMVTHVLFLVPPGV